MKEGQDALDQYTELASALRTVGAGWAVDEVEEVVARGKTVVLGQLSRDEQRQFERRLTEETRKGLPVGKAKANDFVGTAYRPDERLHLLVDAAERVVGVSVHSHEYVSDFAMHYDLQSVILEGPVGAASPDTRAHQDIVPLSMPSETIEGLQELGRILRDEVME